MAQAENGFISAASNGRHTLLITRNLPAVLDRRIWQHATALAEAGYTVSIICPMGSSGEASYEQLGNIHIFRYPPPKTGDSKLGQLFDYGYCLAWELLLTSRVFFTVGVDVVHTCNPPDNVVFVGGFFKIFFNKKLIFDQRTASPSRKPKAAFKLANMVLCASDRIRALAMKQGNLPQEKTALVKSAIDPERIRALPADVSLKDKRKYLVGYAGVIHADDGMAYFVEAARTLLQDKKRNDIHFVLACDDRVAPSYKKLISLLGIGDYFSFSSLQPQEKLFTLLSTCDLCIASSDTGAEGDMLMEYMALGRSVILPDAPGSRALAGDAASYSAPDALAGQIATLLDNPAERAALGTRARARAESELSWKNEIPALLAAYDTIFKDNAKR